MLLAGGPGSKGNVKQKEQPESCSLAFVYDEVLISLGLICCFIML